MIIGIITLSSSDNCGSLLQTYALQEYLVNKYGISVKIINLITRKSDVLYSISPFTVLNHPRRALFNARYYCLNKLQKEDYKKYREKKLLLTERIYRDIKDLEHIDDEYKFEMIIAGSDQIWNLNMSDFSECFFLPIKTSARKITYATSLGSMKDIPFSSIDKVKYWIKDFQKISVREPSGAQTLSTITNHPISVLCDPTLLHDSDYWIKEAGERHINNPYIFFYSWAYPDKEMNHIVEKFAKDKKLDVYVINSSKWYKFRPERFGFKLYEHSGPDTFLNLMAHAEYVFVQSFHGAVFANLLKKRFFFLNEQIDKLDFRSGNFLKMLNEEAQIVHTYEDVLVALETSLTFESEKLSELICRSKRFLDEAVKEGSIDE